MGRKWSLGLEPGLGHGSPNDITSYGPANSRLSQKTFLSPLATALQFSSGIGILTPMDPTFLVTPSGCRRRDVVSGWKDHFTSRVLYVCVDPVGKGTC